MRSRDILPLSLLCLALVAAGILSFPGAGRASKECARIGDSASQVLRFCGEPSWADTWEERRVGPVAISRYYDGWLIRDRMLLGVQEYTVVVDEWTYNLGPSHFVRILQFENGILRSVRTGGYGR